VADGASGDDLPIVFLHSSFRTSSTWLWGKFRADSRRLCFYEPFQERLADCTLHGCLTVGPDSWQSGHPPGPAYLLEFIPLLRRQGGIEGFDASMSFESFTPEGGMDGALSPQEAHYLSRLIELARSQGKQPVLSCTRSLGRAGAMKRGFGGLHILLWRNLHHQWLSYAHQQEIGNPYFMHSLCWTLTNPRVVENQGCDPILRLLFLYMVSHCGNRTSDWVRPDDCDHAYIAFMVLHLHLTMAGRQTADLVMEIDRLNRGDEDYRQGLEYRIAEMGGLPLDLNGARQTVQAPGIRLQNPDYVWEQIELLYSAIIAAAQPDPDTQRFGRGMLEQARKSCEGSDTAAAFDLAGQPLDGAQ